MLVRVVVAVACSFIAVTLAQRSRNQADRGSKESPREEALNDGKEIYTHANAQATPKEEEEEVKCVSSCSPTLRGKSFHESDHLLLPEFDDLIQGGLNFPSDLEKSRLKYDSDDSVEFRRYESNSEDDEVLGMFEALAASSKQRNEHADEYLDVAPDRSSAEIVHLKAIVSDLQQKEMRLEAELLEYYGLKEQDKNHLDLEKQLRRKNGEIEKLNAKLIFLEDQKRQLVADLEGTERLKNDLEAARAKIKELHKAVHSDTGQTKAQLLILKQQVVTLQEKEQEASKKDLNLERKFQTLKELEVEVMELRRTIKDLQHQKRDLTIKVDNAEAKINELSSRKESDMVAEIQAQASTLKLANDDLSKQVEGLQLNRFSEVEELVYLRWVNACLRYELRNFKAAPGKTTALDLGKSLSPKSQEKAKQLMMEYAGPDVLAARSIVQSEQDYDSISSLPSTPSEGGDFDDSSYDEHLTRHSSLMKLSLIKKLRKWGRSKDDSVSPAPSSLDLRNSSSRLSGDRYSKSKGSLETLMLWNNSDSVAITTFGTNEFDNDTISTSDSNESLGYPQPMKTKSGGDTKKVASNVATSFNFMSRSVAGIADEKYPALKDRNKLALAREKAIKEKADQARVEKLVQKLKPVPASSIKSNTPATGKIHPDHFPQVGGDLVLSLDQNPGGMVVSKMKFSEVQKRAPRVPKPSPKSSFKGPSENKPESKTPASGLSTGPPLPPPPPPRAPGGPPPPPPPPGSLKPHSGGEKKVQRAPELVEFYQALMRRDGKKDTLVSISDRSVSDAQNNLIGEMKNRSAFLLAVKADVETQGEFVQSLASEVREAVYTDIKDVVAFVTWLDEELSFLVDERAVLKHFDWPESKADAFREAAFEFQDLKKLEIEISSFKDDPGLSCELALKKMLSLLEKVEQSVYALLRTRDMAIARYKEYNVPTEWMLDSGVVGKIKLGTVKLARKYMKRVALELDASAVASSIKEPQREYLLLQGVRFAFRIHQFAGGFDAESMQTFEELRDRVRAQALDRSVNETNEVR